MKEMYNNYKKELSKKNNILILISVVFILGIIFGSIYITILETEEKTTILNQVESYFLNNKIGFEDKIEIFKNTLISNLTYIASMWVLGLSVIGMPIVFIMIFFKSFVLGFSVSSIFAKYGFKGIIGVLVYLFPSSIVLSIFSLFLATYSIIISFKIANSAFTKKTINFKTFMGRYFFILLVGIILSVLCSLFDTFLSPYLTKIFTNLIK
ncbi:MAG: stage II sporulation protein M [Bacilli bacterium]|nr:stage II sporulation protein M [Bacilli bacterium]